nr:MAG TPA: hypothetical protein [Caudoviricetes sp.]
MIKNHKPTPILYHIRQQSRKINIQNLVAVFFIPKKE